MDKLDEQIAAYNQMKDELEADHFHEWVVFYEGQLINTYPTSQEACQDARLKFGHGPYLIRQVGATPPQLPPALEFGLMYANN